VLEGIASEFSRDITQDQGANPQLYESSIDTPP
jgi:hypothetical protein